MANQPMAIFEFFHFLCPSIRLRLSEAMFYVARKSRNQISQNG